MPRRVSQLAASHEVAALARFARTVWVGVDGRGASGKSRFTERIVAAVPRAVAVHVDDFAGPSIAEWDWQRLRTQVLQPLLAGRPGRYQRWDWDRDEGAEWHDVPVGGIVVVEGVSATRDELGAPWDLTIWVDTPRELRLARAVERDGAAMLSRWLTDWLPSEERYIACQAPQLRADLVVTGTE
jgi:uridine kinase